MLSKPLTRRTFLAAAPLGLTAFSYSRVLGANEALRVASIGCGGKGVSDLNSIAASPHVRVEALCNVDTSEKHLGWAVKKYPGARTFTDWRRVLDEEKALDAVIVSTPDHMHAPIGLAAMHRGKHLFCQKPLTHTVYEARQMRRLAAKNRLVTQMGNQIQSAANYRTAVKLVHDGAIGKVREVQSWQAGSMRWLLRDDRPPGSDPIPEGFNWDHWLGVAPERPYVKDIYHSFNWRAWQDFSNGQLGDFGCHILDPVFMALKLTAPLSVKATASPLNKEVWYKWSVVEYLFPGTELTEGSTVKVTWTDGEGKYPPAEVLGPAGKLPKLPSAGSVILGSKGALLVPHGSAMPTLLPSEAYADFKWEPLPARDHYTSWADACRGVGQTTSHFDYASPLTEAVLLGTIAIRCPGEELKWDSANLTFANHPHANALVSKPYRKGWEPLWV